MNNDFVVGFITGFYVALIFYLVLRPWPEEKR